VTCINQWEFGNEVNKLLFLLLALVPLLLVMLSGAANVQAQRTINYVVQIVTSDSTSWSGNIVLTDINGTGNQTYTMRCSPTIAPIGYYVDAKIDSSADNPPSLTIDLLYNGHLVNSTTVHDDLVDVNIANVGCPTK
jgi:hypothetical protein